MTKSQYIKSLAASPWRFPDADGFASVPSDWAAAAWDVEAVRAPIIDELRRGVSKLGALPLDERQLAKMSRALRTDPVVALYEVLRNEAPHREPEFRAAFTRLFADHANRFPPELTRGQIMDRLDVDEATASELLGDE